MDPDFVWICPYCGASNTKETLVERKVCFNCGREDELHLPEVDDDRPRGIE